MVCTDTNLIEHSNVVYFPETTLQFEHNNRVHFQSLTPTIIMSVESDASFSLKYIPQNLLFGGTEGLS